MPLVDHFPDYQGGSDITKATKYILSKFMQANRSHSTIYTQYVWSFFHLSPFFYPPCMTHYPCENATFPCCLIFLLHIFTSMTFPSLLIAATPKWDAPLKRAGTFYCECLSNRRPSRKHLYNIIVRYAIQKDDDNWRIQFKLRGNPISNEGIEPILPSGSVGARG